MAIRQKTRITRPEGKGTSHARSEIGVDGNTVVIDEPVARGGTDEGPSPTATAYAALIGCTNVAGHKCAARLGIDIGSLDFRMEVDFDRRGVLLMEEGTCPLPRSVWMWHPTGCATTTSCNTWLGRPQNSARSRNCLKRPEPT